MGLRNRILRRLDRRRYWYDIEGWFTWRSGQEEAVNHFDDGSRFVEVGTYLGKSICSLAEVVERSDKRIEVIGIDFCQGSGPEGPQEKNYQGAMVEKGGGTFAGTLHKNVLACGFADKIVLIISDSVKASSLFGDSSLEWVHLDARHDYESVKADIEAWLPKVKAGGWLTGDDYDEAKWPGVVKAVGELLRGAEPWCDRQWRWIVK